MTGPEHYREAEQQIEYASQRGSAMPETERIHLAYAQVHATLALAAATAPIAADLEAWTDVAGTEAAR